MSYRVTVNDVQLFGDNEHYAEWDEYIESLGIKIGPDGQYEGEITDFHACMRVLEQIVKNIVSRRRAEYAPHKARVEKLLAEDPAHKGALELKARYGASIWDFSCYQRWIDQDIQSVFDVCWELATRAYAFLPFTFWMACRDILEPVDPFDAGPENIQRVRIFQFKPGMSARVKAG